MKKVIIDGIEYIPKEIEIWTDPKTGLIWEKFGSKKKMSWKKALEYAKTLGSGWRLPTIQELITLINFSKNNPACKISGTYSSYYWSSTAYVGYTGYAWYIHFSYGDMSYGDKNKNYYIRCVKEGDNYAN